MPDSRAREPLPRDWGDAFGGLPMETPPEGAWQRVAIALPPAPDHRTRWRRPALALAATAFFAAVVPLLHWRTTVDSPLPSQPAPLPEIATSAPVVETPKPPARASIAAEAQDASTSARAPASRARQTPERALQA